MAPFRPARVRAVDFHPAFTVSLSWVSHSDRRNSRLGGTQPTRQIGPDSSRMATIRLCPYLSSTDISRMGISQITHSKIHTMRPSIHLTALYDHNMKLIRMDSTTTLPLFHHQTPSGAAVRQLANPAARPATTPTSHRRAPIPRRPPQTPPRLSADRGRTSGPRTACRNPGLSIRAGATATATTPFSRRARAMSSPARATSPSTQLGHSPSTGALLRGTGQRRRWVQ